MKYTSKEKLNFKKMNMKSLSDKAKKIIAELLLASQVMGTMPTFANNNEINDYDLQQNNFSIEENFSHRDIARDELSKKVIRDYDTIKKINRNNLSEFDSMSIKNLLEKYNTADNINEIYSIDDIMSFDKNEMLSLPQNAIIHIRSSDNKINVTDLYSPNQMIEIQEYFQRHYSEIINNNNLSEKEKFIACMDKMTTLLTYDTQAVEDSQYSKSATVTSRNQYSATKYGTTVCVGYADTVHLIGNILGINVREIEVIGQASTYNNLNKNDKKAILDSMNNGTDFNISDHQANIITFSDGDSYLLDMTNHDNLSESDKNYDSKGMFLTNAKDFTGAIGYITKDKQRIPLIKSAEDRELALKCKQMPREEIEQARKKIFKEIPSLQVSQELNNIQNTINTDISGATNFFKFIEKAKNWTNMLKDRIFGKKTPLLPEGKTTNIIYDDNSSEIHNNSENSNKQNSLNNKEKAILKRKDEIEDEIENNSNNKSSFRNMISNNGKFGKVVEDYMKEYSSSQDKKNQITQKDYDIEK